MDHESEQVRRVVLPEGWDAIEVERVWVHGRPAHLCAEHGAGRATLVLGPADHEQHA